MRAVVAVGKRKGAAVTVTMKMRRKHWAPILPRKKMVKTKERQVLLLWLLLLPSRRPLPSAPLETRFPSGPQYTTPPNISAITSAQSGTLPGCNRRRTSGRN